MKFLERGATHRRHMRKTKLVVPVYVAAAALWGQSVCAQGWGYGVQQPGAGAHKGAYGAPQGRPVRDAGGPPPVQPAGRPQGAHMTEEQRRQLHRDLDKANREIYGVPRGR